MHVIPVLDLKGGVVVLAAGGRRDHYRPIDTRLCHDPAPPRVVDSFLGIYHFDIFYVADLDAIEGVADNARPIVGLAQTHPQIEFWIDAGFAAVESLRPYESVANIRFVIGSESLRSVDDYATMRRDPRFNRHILSLDRRDGIELGPPDLIDREELWPNIVISMDLAQVGRSAGPNLDRLAELRGRREDLNVVAAGGVRGFEDLLALAANDVRYALVATALHDRRLTRRDLERLAHVYPQSA